MCFICDAACQGHEMRRTEARVEDPSPSFLQIPFHSDYIQPFRYRFQELFYGMILRQRMLLGNLVKTAGGCNHKHLRAKGPDVQIVNRTELWQLTPYHIWEIAGMSVFWELRLNFVAKVQMANERVPWRHGLSTDQQADSQSMTSSEDLIPALVSYNDRLDYVLHTA